MAMIDEAGLGERLLRILQEQKLKKVEFARAMGISANYVSLLTAGKKLRISDTLAKLIEITYGYQARWLLTGQPPVYAENDASRMQELDGKETVYLRSGSYSEIKKK